MPDRPHGPVQMLQRGLRSPKDFTHHCINGAEITDLRQGEEYALCSIFQEGLPGVVVHGYPLSAGPALRKLKQEVCSDFKTSLSHMKPCRRLVPLPAKEGRR